MKKKSLFQCNYNFLENAIQDELLLLMKKKNQSMIQYDFNDPPP